MGDSLDNAYLNSSRCNDFEPVITELVKHVRMLENRVGSGLSVSVGSTDTLEPGEDAYVTNGGTKQQARLQFGIPRGADGKPGKDGTPGAKGDKGDKGDSYTITEADYDAIAAIAESDLQPKLDAKANIASPAFTGKPTAPYPTAYNAGQIANMRWVNERVASIASYPYGIDKFSDDSSAIVIAYNTGAASVIAACKYNTYEPEGTVMLGDISFETVKIGFICDILQSVSAIKTEFLNMECFYTGVIFSFLPLVFEYDLKNGRFYIEAGVIYNSGVGTSLEELFENATFVLYAWCTMK